MTTVDRNELAEKLREKAASRLAFFKDGSNDNGLTYLQALQVANLQLTVADQLEGLSHAAVTTNNFLSASKGRDFPFWDEPDHSNVVELFPSGGTDGAA